MMVADHGESRLPVRVTMNHRPHHARRGAIPVEHHLRTTDDVQGRTNLSIQRGPHERLDGFGSFGPSHGAEQQLTVAGEQRGVRGEVTGVECRSVIDEKSMNLGEIFQSSQT